MDAKRLLIEYTDAYSDSYFKLINYYNNINSLWIKDVTNDEFNYVESNLCKDKNKKIIEFGSGCGQLAFMLQSSGYDVIATGSLLGFN